MVQPMVKVTVKESTMVKPMAETPSGIMRLADLDSMMPSAFHNRSVIFYRNAGAAADFFDTAVLKAALSKALVMFYPYAGRLRRDENGRLEIDCNGEGVLLVEAECDATMDEVGFEPRADVSFLPKIDYSQDISTLPVSLLQITRFTCGGVSLGTMNEHHVADGVAGLHYINSWSEIARGATPEPPYLDRSVLSPRNPPQPQFPHIEYQLPPSLNTPLEISETSFKILKLSRDQINALKRKSQHADENGNKKSYTSYESVAGHVWRCVCMARRLPADQETKLQLPVDGRARLQPPLPANLFANGIFYTAAIAKCAEMESKPLSFAAGKVHESVVRMDNDYMRSAMDYLAVQLPESKSVVRNVQCPNFGMTSWVWLPFYKGDFGWGKPVYAGPAAAPSEGKSYLLIDPENEGGLLLAISLYKPHMELFLKLIYDI